MNEWGEAARVTTDEGWTKRINRDTTASSTPSEYPNSV